MGKKQIYNKSFLQQQDKDDSKESFYITEQLKNKLLCFFVLLIPIYVFLSFAPMQTASACSRNSRCIFSDSECIIRYRSIGNEHQIYYLHREKRVNSSYGQEYTEDVAEIIGTGSHVEQTVYGYAVSCTSDGKTDGIKCALCNEVIVAQTTINAPGHTQVADPEIIATCTTDGLTAGAHCSACGLILAPQTVIPARGHQEVVDVAVVATCTSPGKTKGSHCSVCGKVFEAQEDIPKLDHRPIEVAGKEATCTQTGLTAGSCCSVCGTVLVEQQTIPVKDHTVVIDPAREPTCVSAGQTEGSHCSVCNQIVKPWQTIPPNGHTIVTDPGKLATCTETGLTEGSHCSVCGEVILEQRTTPVCGHVIVYDVLKSATCTETGLTEGKHCSACGEVLEAQQTIPALGHKPVTKPGREATCTGTGLTEGSYCATCLTVFTEQETIPAKGHTVVIDAAVEPTCLELGWTEGSHCSVCKAYLKVQHVINPKGHTIVTDVGKAATCTEPGLTNGKRCSVCNMVIEAQQKIAAKGHKVVIDAAKEPTCTKTGLTRGSHCSTCGEVLEAQQTIPAKGHAIVIDAGKAETCTDMGLTEGSHCSVCNTVLTTQQTIPAKGHAAVIDAAKEPTCTETGLTEGSHCSTCSKVLQAQQTIPAKGHTIVSNPGKAATCTDTGLTEGSHCSVCNIVLTTQQTIPAKGHTVVIDAAKEPTCTETGLTEGSHCSTCSEVIQARQMIPAKGHATVIDAAKAETCTDTGLTEGSHCSVCGTVFTTQQIIPARGHTVVTDAAKTPTCTETGLTEGSHCSICGYVIKEQSTISPYGHTVIVEKQAKQPTCTQEGCTEESHCSVCGVKMHVSTIIPATGHEYIKETIVPTCTEQGFTVYTCKKCNDTYSGDYVNALGHEFRLWYCVENDKHVQKCLHENCNVINKQASCDTHFEYTIKEQTLSLCPICIDYGGRILTEIQNTSVDSNIEIQQSGNLIIHGLGYPFGEDRVYLPDYAPETDITIPYAFSVALEAEGRLIEWKDMYNISCDSSFMTEGAALLRVDENVDGMRTLSDIEYIIKDDELRFDAFDNALYLVVVKEEGHIEIIDTEKIEPTCTQTGMTASGHCSICGKQLQVATLIEALGHTIVTDTAVEASCTAVGYTEGSHCSVCGTVFTVQVELPKLEHTIVIDPAVKATYETMGRTEGSHCKVCGTVIVPQKEIEKLSREMSTSNNTVDLSNVSVGSTITLGQYEQDNKSSNGKEPIEWKIISVDNEKHTALVISTYGLDGMSYGKPMDMKEYERSGLNWETSYLRKWLNEEFYSKAFTEEEKNRILESSIQTIDKAGICNTQDKIFVLSGSEVKKYFKNAKDAACKITNYSKNKLKVEQGAEKNGLGMWWLRDMTSIVHIETNGNFMQNTYNEAAYVWGDTGTKLYDQGKGAPVFVDYLASVRPAMWIQLNTNSTEDNLQIEDCDPAKKIISSCPYLTMNRKETKEYYSSSASYEKDFPEGIFSHTWKITIQEGVITFSDALRTIVLTVRNNGKVYELIPTLKWEISLLEALPEIEKFASSNGILLIAEKKVSGGDYIKFADSNGVIDLMNSEKYEGVLSQEHTNLGLLEVINAFGSMGN